MHSVVSQWTTEEHKQINSSQQFQLITFTLTAECQRALQETLLRVFVLKSDCFVFVSATFNRYTAALKCCCQLKLTCKLLLRMKRGCLYLDPNPPVITTTDQHSPVHRYYKETIRGITQNIMGNHWSKAAIRSPAPPVHTSKCPWARHWHSNCSWGPPPLPSLVCKWGCERQSF